MGNRKFPKVATIYRFLQLISVSSIALSPEKHINWHGPSSGPRENTWSTTFYYRKSEKESYRYYPPNMGLDEAHSKFVLRRKLLKA